MNTPAVPFDRTELQSVNLFHDADLDQIETVLRGCPIRTLARGETLISAGQTNQNVFLILGGRLRVHLQHGDVQPVAILEPGESVGEISIIDRQPTSAHVVADDESRVLVLSDEQMWALVRTSHAVACNLLQALAQRLRYGNAVIQKIQVLLREYEYNATIDALTGLYNRRWFDNMLRRLMQRCTSGGEPLCMVMIDIDDFKRFNDVYGHLAGDRALNTVARCLLNNLRPEDMVARFGGEELIALLPGTLLEEAQQIAERLRHAVATTPIAGDGDGGELEPLTISLGIAELEPGQSPQALVGAADAALYRAKRAGRNRVSV